MRKSSFWLVCLILLVGVIGLSFILPNRTLKWWDHAHYEYPAWSPDGAQILYLFKQGTGPSRLVVTGRTGIGTRLDLTGSVLMAPAWRSNSEVSVFLQTFEDLGTNARPKAVLWLYDLDLGTLQTIDAPLSVVGGTAWHPDSSYALVSFRDFQLFTLPTMQPGIYSFTPEDKQFRLWRTAEWPGAIKWSPNGRYLAYLDLVTTEEGKQWQLQIVDMENIAGGRVVELTAFRTNDQLGWSPSGEWILLHQTRVKELSSPQQYETLTGFTFISMDNLEHEVFWPDSDNFPFFDWSPDGSEIVATTVTTPWTGANSLKVLSVPSEFR